MTIQNEDYHYEDDDDFSDLFDEIEFYAYPPERDCD